MTVIRKSLNLKTMRKTLWLLDEKGNYQKKVLKLTQKEVNWRVKL